MVRLLCDWFQLPKVINKIFFPIFIIDDFSANEPLITLNYLAKRYIYFAVMNFLFPFFFFARQFFPVKRIENVKWNINYQKLKVGFKLYKSAYDTKCANYLFLTLNSILAIIAFSFARFASIFANRSASLKKKVCYLPCDNISIFIDHHLCVSSLLGVTLISLNNFVIEI